MAYPAFHITPFQYRFNFHALETRGHQGPNSVRVIAIGDSDATAFGTMLSLYTVGQLTSTSKRVGVHNPNVAHPAGTRMSSNVLALTSSGFAQRFHLRNAGLSAALMDSGLQALLTGVADIPSGVLALTAPNTVFAAGGGPAFTVVNVTPIIKN